MADNIIDIASICPLKFTQVGYVNPPSYNTKFQEDFLFSETIPFWYQPACFIQPWQKNDNLFIQALANFGPHQMDIYNRKGKQVDSFQMTYKPTSIEGTGLKAFEAGISFNTYEEDFYKFYIKSGSPKIISMESEWISVKTVQPMTLLAQYYHDKNDFDTAFETGIKYNLRIPGHLKQLAIYYIATVFADQPGNFEQLKRQAFYTLKLFIGGPFGVPDWFIKKIADIYMCKFVSLDGRQNVVNEGARFESAFEQDYALSGWNIELRDAIRNTRKRFVADGTSNSPSTILNLVESRGFGAISEPASTNIIQIENLL